MKNILVATTALLALSFITTTAHAKSQDKMSVRVSGLVSASGDIHFADAKVARLSDGKIADFQDHLNSSYTSKNTDIWTYSSINVKVTAHVDGPIVKEVMGYVRIMDGYKSGDALRHLYLKTTTTFGNVIIGQRPFNYELDHTGDSTADTDYPDCISGLYYSTKYDKLESGWKRNNENWYYASDSAYGIAYGSEAHAQYNTGHLLGDFTVGAGFSLSGKYSYGKTHLDRDGYAYAQESTKGLTGREYVGLQAGVSYYKKFNGNKIVADAIFQHYGKINSLGLGAKLTMGNWWVNGGYSAIRSTFEKDSSFSNYYDYDAHKNNGDKGLNQNFYAGVGYNFGSFDTKAGVFYGFNRTQDAKGVGASLGLQLSRNVHWTIVQANLANSFTKGAYTTHNNGKSATQTAFGATTELKIWF